MLSTQLIESAIRRSSSTTNIFNFSAISILPPYFRISNEVLPEPASALLLSVLQFCSAMAISRANARHRIRHHFAGEGCANVLEKMDTTPAARCANF
jgi:hypothetical protein